MISHTMSDGSEHPIAFASRTLTTSERNYAQLDRGTVLDLWNSQVPPVFVWDHKPLTTILGPKTGIPLLAAARLQRWAILLSAYQYKIKFRSTNCHTNADGLSRLPLTQTKVEDSSAPSIFNIAQINSLPVTSENIQQATKVDPRLSKVLMYVRDGWPADVPEELKLFYNRHEELSLEDQCNYVGDPGYHAG